MKEIKICVGYKDINGNNINVPFDSEGWDEIEPVYETMQGLNPNILTGVVDPRIPYYWHRQLLPGDAAENPVEYLQADGFLSIHFSSIHPNQASGQQSSQTVFGLYPCGGFYDDDSGT